MPEFQSFSLRGTTLEARAIDLTTPRGSVLFTLTPDGNIQTGGGMAGALGRSFRPDELRLVANLAERFQDTWERLDAHARATLPTLSAHQQKQPLDRRTYPLPTNLLLLPYQLELVALPAGARTYPQVENDAQGTSWSTALEALEREVGLQVEKVPQAQATHKLAYSWWDDGKWHEQKYAALGQRDYLPQYIRLVKPDPNE